ncbi:nucleoside deaminase [Alkalicoccus urumqiensis]|uniref:tRNA-specific adenosine deaminase n=1 Tax=Alkalicoccus urumqiensis TaxID=1548213 RepID=A0A2P6MHK6_ALKUR|nr:nucleoside deaminase [Alkalicoccus urumqiensis]PRO65730.1 tRNA-specific adenosine deaminase [Alkalicoccus urumqiensis]
MEEHQKWIEKCIRMAVDNTKQGQDPFAAVVVKDGEEVASGVNDGKAAFDPTAHGEIRALQAAGRALESRDLSGCVLYTNCEPCPMCYAAIFWSGITDVYYGLSVAEQNAFDDKPQQLYDELRKDPGERSIQPKAVETAMDPMAPFE